MKKKRVRRKGAEAWGPAESVGHLGQRFVRLGEALQDGDTTLRDLVTLAMNCGFTLSIRIRPIDTRGV